ncbi:MAG: glycosyltransferase [Bacteroidaceae bacterium]|nr:glycosyltransferase [Bacteroidaceae bacterium]
MSSSPKFSIITVTYNAAQVIEPTLRSIIAQTYTNYEFLLIDGGSSDNTVAIVRQSGVRVTHLVSEPDKGLYDAMNKGLKIATGDYLCFLNAGDAFHAPDTLEKVAACAISQNSLPGVLYGETAEVDAARHFMRMRRLQAPENLTWRSFKQGMLVCHQAFYARRDLAPLFNLEYRYSSDVDWCIRVMKRSEKMLNVHLTVVDYLQNGLSLQHHRASLIERFKVMSKHYGLLSTIIHHLWFVVRAVIKK